jgi:hypothetical protein
MKARTIGALILLGGCLPLPGGRELSRRQVWAKEGETTLVDRDGARCQVAADRFERTRIGDRAVCAWQDRNVFRAEVPAPRRGLPDAGGRRRP